MAGSDLLRYSSARDVLEPVLGDHGLDFWCELLVILPVVRKESHDVNVTRTICCPNITD